MDVESLHKGPLTCEPPETEGGENRRAERVWTRDFVLVCLTSLATALVFQFLMPTLPLYMKSLGGRDADIGLILGVYSIAALVTRVGTGRALDLWGRKWVLVAGAGLFFLAMPLYALTTTVFSILLLRVFHGIGFGIAGTATSAVAADLAPVHRRGEALGYFGLAQSLSMALGPGIAFGLLEVRGLPLSGFPLLFGVCVVIAGFEVLFALLLRETRRPPVAASAPAAGRGVAGFFSRDAVPPAIAMVFAAFAQGGVMSFAPLYLSTDSTGNVAVYFFVNAIVIAVSRPFIGAISDRVGRRAVVIPLMAVAAVGVSILGLAPTLPVAVVTAIVFGLGFGSIPPTMMALVVDVVDPQERGAALATYMCSLDIGISAGSMVLGLVAQTAGYRAVFPLGGLVGIFGIVYFLGYQRFLARRPSVVGQPPTTESLP